MYNTMFKNLKEVSENEIILKANFTHMLYDEYISHTFILNIEDTENDDITIKQYLAKWGAEHGYYLIENSIEVFTFRLNKLNI